MDRKRSKERVAGGVGGNGRVATASSTDLALAIEERLGGLLTLTVPARPEAVRIVRAVTRTWAASDGFVLDEIEELCLAVDEAFAGLIATRPLPTNVVVRIRSDANVVDIVAIRDADAELWPPISAQTALVRRVLSTLIDEVDFERTDEGPAIHMVKRRASGANGQSATSNEG